MWPPLQRSSMFLPGVRMVLSPRRRKRPLSRTCVSSDWLLSFLPFRLGRRILTRFPPGRVRISPTSFLLFNTWQAPAEAERREQKEPPSRDNRESVWKSDSKCLIFSFLFSAVFSLTLRIQTYFSQLAFREKQEWTQRKGRQWKKGL